MLLHNSKKDLSIPVAHDVGLKETYENMQLILKAVNYNAQLWRICGDLKVIGLLLGLQDGFTKYCYFLYLWDSRETSKHYLVKDWPIRDTFTPEQNNIKYVPLVNPQKVILPPLHIKLGLMKIFVKALNKEEPGLKHLSQVFPRLSEAILKEEIFVGPQI